MPSDDVSNPNLITEWQAARTILLETDGRLLDLRKVGFSVLTGLLAVSAFLLPSNQLAPVSGSVTVFPETIKFAILAVVLILVIAFQMLDRNFQVLQQAAATRAMVIERELDLELTEIISSRYSVNWVRWFMAAVYGLYAVGVWVLGYFVLQSHTLYYQLLVALSLATIIITVLLTSSYNASFRRCGKIDWTIDRTQCTADDEVGITLTNFDKKNGIHFKKGAIVWQVTKEGEKKLVHSEKLKKPLSIGKEDSYTWLWEAPEKGIYRIQRAVHPEKEHPSRLEKFSKKLRKRIKRALKPATSSEVEKPKLVQLQRKVRVKSKPEPKPYSVILAVESNRNDEPEPGESDKD